MKRFLAISGVVLLLAAVVAGLGWERYRTFLETPLNIPPGGQVFHLQAGASGNDVVAEFARLGYTRADWQWKVLMRLEPRIFRAGEYKLDSELLPSQVLELLSNGKVVQYRLTVVEGWTFRQLAEFLGGHDILEHEIDLSDPSTGLETLLDDAHPEGWFLPETYQFVRGDSDLDILLRAHEAMKNTLDEAWQSRETGLPLDTPYDLLILASIIEKETALDSERDQVAGVFIRRLRKGMRLQTDPTVIYGLGEAYDGDIKRKDLRTDTPYNTYTRHGLPPTPIALPGRASLLAAAHPADGNALYFVADGAGGHTFSATLEEHQAAVRKLLGKP